MNEAQIFASVLHVNLIQLFLQIGDLFCLNQNICRLSTCSSTWLMNHDSRVGQTVPHSLSSSSQKKTSHATSLSDTPGADGRQDVLHGVIDGQARGDAAPGLLMYMWMGFLAD